MSEGNDDGWTFNTLKHWIDEALGRRDKAVDTALEELNRHLRELNNSHALAREKEKDFFSHRQHEEYVKSIDEKFERVADNMKTPWGIYIGALGLMGSLLGVMYWLTINPITDKVTANTEVLKAHIEADKVHEEQMLELQKRQDLQRSDLQTLQKWWTEHSSMKRDK